MQHKQKYLREANAQRAMLEYQSNILRGTAGALGSTQTQYAASSKYGISNWWARTSRARTL